MNSDILCSGCAKKLESGQISGADVAVSRALCKAAKDKKPADFLQAVEHKDKIIIVCEKKDARLIIGKAGKNVKEIGKTLGREIRVIEKSDEKTMIENILGAPVIGINIVYGGGETKRIRADKAHKKLRGDAALLEKILRSKYEIVFE